MRTLEIPLQAHAISFRYMDSLIPSMLANTGSIPTEIFQLPKLKSIGFIDVPHLKTEVVLHEVIQNMQGLEVLELSRRKFGDTLSIPCKEAKPIVDLSCRLHSVY